MPEFLNPFSGVVPRKLTKPELIRAIRLNLAAELEAVHLYLAHAEATDDALARQVLIEVANEERQHMGEFLELLRRLAPDEQHFLDIGQSEVEALASGPPAEQASEVTGESQKAPPTSPNLTIGRLR
jgi:rubrerythrin